ncbi:MAG: extracellular solute-binding protein [Clostridiaceae bacterium]|nr:extracellular solute-binding protein [Clostridiaceae bacterium]
MPKGLFKKLTSVAMSSAMVIGLTSCGIGSSSSSDELITLDVYSQLANFSGEQTGWIADILKEKFNVKLNIIPDGTGVYETRMENGDLGDIVVWSNDSDQYPTAVQNGLLFDWNEDDILTDYGSYIKENMSAALQKNQELTSTITDGESDTLYGFGHNVATSSEDHESFFYTWDVRWDLYKELGYPEVKDLDDFKQLMKDMVNLCPTDDTGGKTYAVSLWPDWDDAMVMYVKSTVTAYYGYDELGIGLYDPDTGTFHGALEENGPYLEMLKFYNDLYQEGLLDPDSMTQTYDQMIEKVQNGGTMFSIFNYSGSLGYNKESHLKEGKYMYCMKPEEATPIVYGMNPQGGDRIWSIGANTEYPERCMEVINWLCTPEGTLTTNYGPQGVCWDYDEDGNTYLTELGAACKKNTKTEMPDPYTGTFHDGSLQITNTTWSIDASNPESNGETYNSDNWKNTLEDTQYEIQEDWSEKTGCSGINDYMESSDYVLAPGTSYSKGSKSEELKTTWSQVTTQIKNSSWKAIYAKSDAEYEKRVNEMISKCKEYGYEDCVTWSENEASIRKQLEDEVRATDSSSDDEATDSSSDAE